MMSESYVKSNHAFKESREQPDNRKSTQSFFFLLLVHTVAPFLSHLYALWCLPQQDERSSHRWLQLKKDGLWIIIATEICSCCDSLFFSRISSFTSLSLFHTSFLHFAAFIESQFLTFLLKPLQSIIVNPTVLQVSDVAHMNIVPQIPADTRYQWMM